MYFSKGMYFIPILGDFLKKNRQEVCYKINYWFVWNIGIW